MSQYDELADGELGIPSDELVVEPPEDDFETVGGDESGAFE